MRLARCRATRELGFIVSLSHGGNGAAHVDQSPRRIVAHRRMSLDGLGFGIPRASRTTGSFARTLATNDRDRRSRLSLTGTGRLATRPVAVRQVVARQRDVRAVPLVHLRHDSGFVKPRMTDRSSVSGRRCARRSQVAAVRRTAQCGTQSRGTEFRSRGMSRGSARRQQTSQLHISPVRRPSKAVVLCFFATLGFRLACRMERAKSGIRSTRATAAGSAVATRSDVLT